MWMALFGVAVLCLVVYYTIAQKQQKEYKNKLVNIEKQFDELQHEKLALETKLEKTVDEKKEQQSTSTKQIQELNQQLQEKKQQLQLATQQHQESEESYQQQLNDLQKKIESKTASAQQTKNILESQITELEASNKNYQEQIKQEKQAQQDLKTDLQVLENKLQEQLDAIAQTEKKQDVWQGQLEEKDSLIQKKDQEMRALLQKRNDEQQQLMEQIQQREEKNTQLKEQLQQKIEEEQKQQSFISQLEKQYEDNLKVRSETLQEISSLLQRLTSLPSPNSIMNTSLKNTRKFTLEGDLKKQVLVKEQKNKENAVVSEIKQHLENRDSIMARYLDVLQKFEAKIQRKIDRSQGIPTENSVQERYMQKLLLSLLITTSFLVADDWPQWRGNNGDGIALQKNIPVEWPEKGLPVIWRAQSGAGYSGISIANSRAYTLCGINSDVFCIAYDCNTGKIVWKKRIGEMFTSSWGDGPRSTPTFHENKIYTIGSRGELWCLNAKDGTSIWHINLLKKFTTSIPRHGFAGSPIIYKDIVLYNVGGPKNSFVAFDKNTGEVVWKNADDKAAYSTPLIAQIHNMTQAIFFSANGAVGVNPENGDVLWRYPWTTSYNVHAASPIAQGNKVFISSGYSSGSALFAVKKQDKFSTEKIWETQQLKNHFSSSILSKDHIYGFHNAILTCIELETGEVKWRQRGFRKGSLVAINDYLLILSENGDKLALAEINSQSYKEKAQMSAFPNTRCWSVPTIANNRIYLRNEKEIMCVNFSIE